MLNQNPLSKLSDSLRNDVKKSTLEIATSIENVRNAVEGEGYAISAFDGGDRHFASRDEIRAHYRNSKADAAKRGEAALERMLDAIDQTLRGYFHLDAQVIQAFQTKLDLAGLSESDLQRIAMSASDDYSALMTVGSHGLTKGSSFGKAVAARLKDFEDAAEDVRTKSEKYAAKALRGDTYCADGWHGWINECIDAVDAAFDDLQDAVSGREGLQFTDVFADFARG